MLTVRLSKELEARLNEVIAKTGINKSAFVRDAIEHCIPRWEKEILAEIAPVDFQRVFQNDI